MSVAQLTGGVALRVTTYNVNGLRAYLKRRLTNLKSFLSSLQADIVCIQETKLTKPDYQIFANLALAEGWESYFSFCRVRGGYSGVCTFCRTSTAAAHAAREGLTGTLPSQAHQGALDDASSTLQPYDEELLRRYSREELLALDQEGRTVVTDHGSLVIFNVYMPAVTDRNDPRFAMKLRLCQILEARIHSLLATGRAVLLLGDLNIAATPQDHCDYRDAPADVQARFYDGRPDRSWLAGMMRQQGGPLVDLYRHLHPRERKAFTVWNAAMGARNDRHGSRVDYILLGEPQQEGGSSCQDCPSFLAGLKSVQISREVAGSDHAPVTAEFDVQLLPRPDADSPPALCTSHLVKGRVRTILDDLAGNGQAYKKRQSPGAGERSCMQRWLAGEAATPAAKRHRGRAASGSEGTP